MDAVVQFIRNALCCVKDLNLFADGILYKSAGLTFLPSPMDETTLLEMCIGITQFYAFVTVSLSGFRLLYNKGWKPITKMAERTSAVSSKAVSNRVAYGLVQERLSKEWKEHARNMFVGLNVFCIGIAFFWLAGNSFHVTETSWIGGIQGLIHALTVMEIALVPLLWFMITDSIQLLGQASVMEYLSQILSNCARAKRSTIPPEILTEKVVTLLEDGGGGEPFWGGKSNVLEDDENHDGQMKSLLSKLDSWTKPTSGSSSSSRWEEAAQRLQSQAVITRYEAYREQLYFVLNFVAFYGYFLGILTYYVEEESLHGQHYSMRTLKLGMTHEDADWTGNFAGDLMWTIEPMIILASPSFFTLLKPRPKKDKQD
mmetsp:Transcript_15827/g.23971  ORF Transcript_15827/g.23971 Transcript_15827/m.23971 type:complete len:371 (-) Transcript_15827:199-1311(-)